MSIKKLINNIPFLAQAGKTITDRTKNKANEKVVRQLTSSHHYRGMQIGEALMSFTQNLSKPDKDWIRKIDDERKRLGACTEPLNDGSLGDGGLFDKKETTIQQAYSVSKGRKPALFLYLLTRAIKPLNVIELGTNVGISSAYIGAALKMNGQDGRVVTLEASAYRQRLAKEVHRNIGLDNVSYVKGLFSDTLGSTLNDLGTIELAFIDGHHQYQPTLDYFDEISKFSTPDTVFVFDDIRWSDGMEKAWGKIQSDERLDLLIDLFSVGIGVNRQNENTQRFVFGPINLFD